MTKARQLETEKQLVDRKLIREHRLAGVTSTTGRIQALMS
jgi:hypothetical protein